jgi:hypothetical protein
MPTPTSTARNTATPPMTHLAKHLSQAAHTHVKLRTTTNHAPPTMDLGPYPFHSYLRLTILLRTDLYTLPSVKLPSLFSFHTTLLHPLHSTNTCHPQYIQTPHPWSSLTLIAIDRMACRWITLLCLISLLMSCFYFVSFCLVLS